MRTTPLLLTEFGGAASADVDAPADQVFAAITDIAARKPSIASSSIPPWSHIESR
jgi:hypothetical protein